MSPSLPRRRAFAAAVLAVAVVLTGACGRGEDRPGQITTETPGRGTPTTTAGDDE